MKYLKELLARYRRIILYCIFGLFTTVVNVGVYYLCFSVIALSNVLSTLLAWFISVLFAFVTNKIWVFESRLFKAVVLLREALSFFSCRLLTGALDLLIMYVAVDVMGWNEMLWKLISNVIVIVINYGASRILIFRK